MKAECSPQRALPPSVSLRDIASKAWLPLNREGQCQTAGRSLLPAVVQQADGRGEEVQAKTLLGSSLMYSTCMRASAASYTVYWCYSAPKEKLSLLSAIKQQTVSSLLSQECALSAKMQTEEIWLAFAHTISPVCYSALNPQGILPVLSCCWSIEYIIPTTAVVSSAAFSFIFLFELQRLALFFRSWKLLNISIWIWHNLPSLQRLKRQK